MHATYSLYFSQALLLPQSLGIPCTHSASIWNTLVLSELAFSSSSDLKCQILKEIALDKYTKSVINTYTLVSLLLFFLQSTHLLLKGNNYIHSFNIAFSWGKVYEGREISYLPLYYHCLLFLTNYIGAQSIIITYFHQILTRILCGT